MSTKTIQEVARKLLNDVQCNLSPLEDNENYEVEIRLGKSNSTTFCPFVSCKTFEKIIDSIVLSGPHDILVQTFIDRTYRDRLNNEQMICRSQKDLKFENIKNTLAPIIQGKTMLFSDLINSRNTTVCSKRKINQFTQHNIRYNFNLERIPNVKPEFDKIDWVRVKTRFSCELNEFYRLDLTIVQQLRYYEWKKIIESKSMNNFRNICKPTYMVEIEMLPNAIQGIDAIGEEYLSWCTETAIQQVNKHIFNERHFLFHHVPKHPITLHRKHLPLLNKNYAITPKANGIRSFLIVVDGKAYFQNPNTSIVDLTISVKDIRTDMVFLVDGEFMMHSDNSLNWTYLIFDAIIIPKQNYALANLFEELKLNQVDRKDSDSLKVEADSESLGSEIFPGDNSEVKSESLEDNSEFQRNNGITDEYSWQDIGGLSFEERIKQLKPFIPQLQKIAPNGSFIKLKKFYGLFVEDNGDPPISTIYEQASILWNYSVPNQSVPYDTDGLMLVAKYMPYYSAGLPNLKWKPYHTIDVRVEYVPTINFTYFHYAGRHDKHKVWRIKGKTNLPNDNIKHARFTIGDQHCIQKLQHTEMGLVRPNARRDRSIFFLGTKGRINGVRNKFDIVEVEYKNGKWQLCGIRKDKQKPNGHATIYNNIQAALENLQINDIASFTPKEPVGQLYDHVCNRSASFNRLNWRKYNNFRKIQLFKHITGSEFHLELCCGKLQDLFKYVACNIQNVLAIDSSYEMIKEAQQRLDNSPDFVKMHYYYQHIHQTSLRITLIYGDVSKAATNTTINTMEGCGVSAILMGDVALDEESKERLKMFFAYTPSSFQGFTSVSCMFAMHYFLGSPTDLCNTTPKWLRDAKKTSQFCMNVRMACNAAKCTFIGIYISGDKLNTMEDHIEFVDKGKALYSITQHEAKTEDELDVLEIQNESWKNYFHAVPITMYEPKLTQVDIEVIMKLCGYTKNITETYKKNEEKCNVMLSEPEEDLCELNDVFVFQR